MSKVTFQFGIFTLLGITSWAGVALAIGSINWAVGAFVGAVLPAAGLAACCAAGSRNAFAPGVLFGICWGLVAGFAVLVICAICLGDIHELPCLVVAAIAGMGGGWAVGAEIRTTRRDAS
jgi:hypothetical protein